MKKHIFILSLLLVITISCDKPLLDEPIYDFRTPETAFASEESTNAILLGMYKTMTAYHYYSSTYSQLLTFNSGWMTRRAGGDADLARLEQTPTKSWIGSVYDAIYSSIAQNNFIIESTSAESQVEYVRNARGQAHFFRAMNYFNLVRLFGPVPLVSRLSKTPEEANVPRAESVDAVYEFIIADLNKAYDLLPEFQTSGLAPKQMAAKALLSKVFLTRASSTNNIEYWQRAKNLADSVIQSGIYSLEANYADLWNVNNEFTSESIVEFGFSNTTIGVGSAFPHILVPQKSGWSSNGTGGWGRSVPTRELYDTIVSTHGGVDPRMEVNVVVDYTRTDGKTVTSYPALTKGVAKVYLPYPSVQKYKDPNGLDNNSHANNYIYLRYAEILLIYAEAENALNGPTGNAVGALNQVLLRARNSGDTGLPDDASTADFASTESFRDRIMVERLSELMGEFHTWFDARRYGMDYFTKVCENHNRRLDLAKTQKVFKSASDFYFGIDAFTIQRNLLLPIPESEINTNEAISFEDQNFGY